MNAKEALGRTASAIRDAERLRRLVRTDGGPPEANSRCSEADFSALSALSVLAEENEKLKAEVERKEAHIKTILQDNAALKAEHSALCEEHSRVIAQQVMMAGEITKLRAEVERGKKATADCLSWDRPMTSGQAAKWLLTGGFIAVELYRHQQARAEKAEAELALAILKYQTELKPAIDALKEELISTRAELDALEGVVSRLCDYEFGQDEEWLDGALISKAQANGRAREGKEPR